jgi:multidrug efflux pump subunit AcrA (membrane-fusion protein)
MTSLHAFCKDHNLAKSTVHRWLTAEGYTTAEGLTPDAIAAALAHFCPAPEPQATEPEVTVLGTVEATLEAPSFNPSVALARLRGGDGEIAAYADPMAAISQALEIFDAAESAMAADLAQRQALLQQTQAASRQMAQRAAALQAQQAEYKIKSDVMAMLQSQETANLGELLGKAQAFTAQPATAGEEG